MAALKLKLVYTGTKDSTQHVFKFSPKVNEWIGDEFSLVRKGEWRVRFPNGETEPCKYDEAGKFRCADIEFADLTILETTKTAPAHNRRRNGKPGKSRGGSSSVRWSVPQPKGVGACLSSRIEGFLATKEAGGCGCAAFSAKMDAWGPDGCERNRPAIIEHLVSNAAILANAIAAADIPGCGLLSKLVGTPAAKPILRIGAGWMLTKAIEDARRALVEHSANVRAAKIMMPVTAQQRQLLMQAISHVPEADPFTGTPIVHFGAHLWPVKTYWRKHVDLWNELAGTIKGKCLVGVVVDKESDSLADVQASLSDRFEVFQMDNTPQGENPTFRELQERIPSGQDDVLIYCHGKGVRAHTAASESVQIWTEMMYETVIFNQEKMLQKLSEGYKIFGSFRTFGNVPLTPHNQWHYSGTFFAVRAKHIPGKTVKTGYGGVEAWPGDHIEAADSWCEFTDGPGFKFGYDLNALYPAIVDAQMQWEVNRLGGPRCEQHKRELAWFLDHLKPDDRVLVIGSKHGGLEHQIKTHCSTIETLSVDIAPQPDNTQPMIVGSSLDHDIQAEIQKRGPFSVVFIDGDHSYQGASEDWSFADQVVAPRLIALHDIADAIKHRREGCEVDRLWQEIKATHRTDEKIVGCGWGGIGIVHP